MVAAHCNDPVFVPATEADRAFGILRALSEAAPEYRRDTDAIPT
jgi:hypothetical protein